MAAYAERTVAALRELPEAHLVGHSMGGMVISAAAQRAPELIRQLIYLCAFVPLDGDSLNSLGRLNRTSSIPAATGIDVDRGILTLREDMLRVAFYHDCGEDSIALAREKLVPQPMAPFNDVLELDGSYAGVPKAYIECLEDQAIHLATQRQCYRRAGITRVATLDTSHSPFFSAPLHLAHTLERLAD